MVVLEALAVLKVVLANLKVVVVVVVAAAVLVAVQKAWDSIAILKRAILAVPKASEEEVHVEVAEADEVVVALVVKVSETEEENGNLNDIVAAIKREHHQFRYDFIFEFLISIFSRVGDMRMEVIG